MNRLIYVAPLLCHWLMSPGKIVYMQYIFGPKTEPCGMLSSRLESLFAGCLDVLDPDTQIGFLPRHCIVFIAKSKLQSSHLCSVIFSLFSYIDA